MSNRHNFFARFSAAVAIALILASGAAAQTRGRTFLWKVQSGGSVMYLAGSVHALTADAYPLNPAYQRAFDASSALVEEIDLAEADPLAGGIGLLAKGMYQDGRTFSSAVSRQTVTLVQEKLKNTPDGESNLLENTLLLYGSPMGDSNLHNHKRCPLFLAGRAGGRINGGLHIAAEDGTPMANAMLSVLHALGMDDIETFGDSSGALDLTRVPTPATGVAAG